MIQHHVFSELWRIPVQFNSPVEVNWEYMDTELMKRYWANHKEERAGTASISDRILVFHRGISTVRLAALLILTVPVYCLGRAGCLTLCHTSKPHPALVLWHLSVHAVQVRAQGTYINDKIDLLIEYLLVDPFQALYRRLFKHEVGLPALSLQVTHMRSHPPYCHLKHASHENISDHLHTALPCGSAHAKLHVTELG